MNAARLNICSVASGWPLPRALRPVAGEVFAVGPDLVYRWLERVNPTLSSATSSSLEVQPVGPMPLHPTQDNGFTLQPPILSTLLLRHRRSGSVQQ